MKHLPELRPQFCKHCKQYNIKGTWIINAAKTRKYWCCADCERSRNAKTQSKTVAHDHA